MGLLRNCFFIGLSFCVCLNFAQAGFTDEPPMSQCRGASDLGLCVANVVGRDATAESSVDMVDNADFKEYFLGNYGPDACVKVPEKCISGLYIPHGSDEYGYYYQNLDVSVHYENSAMEDVPSNTFIVREQYSNELVRLETFTNPLAIAIAYTGGWFFTGLKAYDHIVGASKACKALKETTKEFLCK